MTLDHIAELALLELSRTQRVAAQALGIPLAIVRKDKSK
jgi:hypothetical protein